MALSVVAIKAAKSREKAYRLSDGNGLNLLLTPSGCRYWRMNYRHLRKQKTLAFGVWPDTGLAEARAERDAARKVLARGEDPAERVALDDKTERFLRRKEVLSRTGLCRSTLYRRMDQGKFPRQVHSAPDALAGENPRSRDGR